MPAKELATAILGLKKEIEQDRAMLDLQEKFLRVLLEEDLPDAMQAEEIEQLMLDDGTIVELETSYHGSISEANRADALKWLKEHDCARLIKRKAEIQFGMGALEAAIQFGNMVRKILPAMPIEISWQGATKTTEAEQQLQEMVKTLLGPDHGLTFKDTVHGSTLKSFIQKQMEKGTAFPAELFGAYKRTGAVLHEPIPETPDDGSLERQLKESLGGDRDGVEASMSLPSPATTRGE
jgi:hypothetical protein